MTDGLGHIPEPGPTSRQFEIAFGVCRQANKPLSSANTLTEADLNFVEPADIISAAEAEAFENSRYRDDNRKVPLWTAADAMPSTSEAFLACASAATAASGDTDLATTRIRRRSQKVTTTCIFSHCSWPRPAKIPRMKLPTDFVRPHSRTSKLPHLAMYISVVRRSRQSQLATSTDKMWGKSGIHRQPSRSDRRYMKAAIAIAAASIARNCLGTR